MSSKVITFTPSKPKGPVFRSNDPTRSEIDDEKSIQDLKDSILKHEEFRARAESTPDATYMRFLVARKFDIHKATEMLLGHFRWLDEVKPEQITAEDVKSEALKKVAFYSGKDKSGRKILVLIPARHIVKTAIPEETERYTIYFLYNSCLEFTKTATSMADFGITLIYDRTDFSMGKNFDLQLTGKLMPLLQNQFPEFLGSCYIVEVNVLFYTLYKMVSVFMDSRTHSKINVLKGDYKAALTQIADKDELLEQHGGTKKEDDLPTYPSYSN
eukprot:c10060_g1_i1.p1 GENE.c10060_g1_i1~~c10060_g1_i1.p1  ORF type:complete len:281 (+),score=99.68 c10060_g1_i1:33-845(+)